MLILTSIVKRGLLLFFHFLSIPMLCSSFSISLILSPPFLTFISLFFNSQLINIHCSSGYHVLVLGDWERPCARRCERFHSVYFGRKFSILCPNVWFMAKSSKRKTKASGSLAKLQNTPQLICI